MKKHWFATLLSAGLADVAAAQSSVSIYGIVDVSLASENNGAGHVKSEESGVYNGSRLGFRGTEDLGGGVSANFVLEMGINADTGTLGQGGIGFGRQSWVGLASTRAGAVRLGRQYTPVYIAQLAIDPFVGGMKGDMTSIRSWFNSGGFRVNNSVAYLSPKWGGFFGSALYGFGEVAGNNPAVKNAGFSANYSGGPLVASGAYNYTDNPAGLGSRVWFGGAVYDFGPVRLHAAYDDTRGAAVARVDDTMVGVSAPVGVGTVLASYIRKRNRQVDDANSGQWALGYIYNFSKRTALYTSYASVHNDALAGVNAGGVNGASDKVFDVGLRHIF